MNLESKPMNLEVIRLRKGSRHWDENGFIFWLMKFNLWVFRGSSFGQMKADDCFVPLTGVLLLIQNYGWRFEDLWRNCSVNPYGARMHPSSKSDRN